VDAELTLVQRVRGAYVDALVPAGWVPFHAAAVGAADGIAMLPGPSGAGKSTFAAAMAARGFAVGDELVLVRLEDGRLRALVPPLPLSLRDDALRRVVPGSWPRLSRTGSAGKTLVVPPALLCGEYEIGALVLLDRAEGARAAGVAPAGEFETAKRLMGSMVRFRGAGRESAGARRAAWRVLNALVEGPRRVWMRTDAFEMDPRGRGDVAWPWEGGRDE